MTSAPWFLLNEFPLDDEYGFSSDSFNFDTRSRFRRRMEYEPVTPERPSPTRLMCVRCDATIAPAGSTLSEAPRETNEDIINNSFLTVNNYQRNWNLFRLFSHTQKVLLHENTRCFYIKRSPPSWSYLLSSGARDEKRKMWIINIVITIIHIFPRYTRDTVRES